MIVLSHGMWQRRLGGREDILGTHVSVSGTPYTVIGVAPPEFVGTMPGVPPEFWVPAVHIDRLSIAGATGTAGPPSEDPRIAQRGLRWLFIKGRLADGHSVEEARTQLETLFSRLRTDYAETHENTTSSVVPITSIRFHPMLDGYVRAAGAMLMGAVGWRCWSRARTSRACCWPAAPRAGASSPSAERSAPAAPACCGS